MGCFSFHNIKMDYSFCRPDLEKEAKCESCERDADHVLVLIEKTIVGIF